MATHLFCGEALCKKPVALPAGFTGWPLPCPACGTSLYPSDVLARTPLDELAPKRAALMIERAGTCHEAHSADLDVRPDDATGNGEIDRILAMVDVGEPTAKLRRVPWIWVAVAALVVAAAVALVLLQ